MSAQSTKMIAVRLVHSRESGLINVPDSETFNINDHCIVATTFGRDIAKILGTPTNPDEINQLPEWEYSRAATEDDFILMESNKPREKEAEQVCRELIASHRLAMNLVSAHYVLLDPRLLFYFTADSRVDFRGLIADLIPHFKTRIELRQIGVRDESRMVGGLGICGRPFCCCTVSDRLKPVSIKMAKTQNIPVSSSKISGACGRLLCCLNFEYEAYAEEGKRFPNPGTKLLWGEDRYVVTDVNILSDRVTVIGPGGGRQVFRSCAMCYDHAQRKWSIDPDACGNGHEAEDLYEL